MSTPSGSPERDGPPQLDRPSSPTGLDPDPPSTGSPLLSPDSSSHDALLSAPAMSPADSESLSPDELELLAKLEEQNRWDINGLFLWRCRVHPRVPKEQVGYHTKILY